MRLVKYILSVLCLVEVGCNTPSEIVALIDESERIVADYPDSALRVIESVDKSRVRGREDQARYRLVYSEALYHNQIDSDCDSLTRPLFDYYYDSDRHEERARAMYQHGRVMYNCGRNAEAIYALLEAEKSLQFYDDPRLMGLVYLIIGNIYGSECLFHNSLEVYEKSYKLFDEIGLEYHALFALHNVAECLYSLKEYDKAQQLLDEVVRESYAQGYSELLSFALYSLCDIYLYTDRPSGLGDVLPQFDKCQSPILYPLSFNYYCAIYQAYLGNRSEVFRYMSLADSCSNIEETSVEQLKYYLFNYLGEDRQALYWLSQYMAQQEGLMLEILSLPVLNTQLELLRKDNQIADERVKSLRVKYVGLILLSLLVVVIIVVYENYKILKQKHEIEQYVSIVNELRLTQANEVSHSQSNKSWSVYGSRLNEINTLFETYYEHGNTSREVTKIVEKVKGIVEQVKHDEVVISQLEQMVNMSHNNIIADIKECTTKLNEKEIRYIIYLLSGFSNRSICLLLDMDGAAVSRLKYRTKNKMLECGLNELVDQIFVAR